MAEGFVHLHLHTQYSLLSGAVRLEELFKRVKELGMPAVAMTDSHNLFGAIDFFGKAKAAGVKPIIGSEVNYAPTLSLGSTQGTVGAHQAGWKPTQFHLVLLCKDLKGYQNLCQIVTQSFTRAAQLLAAAQAQDKKVKPEQYKALVDRELLDKYGEGLIVLSAGLKGEIPCRILLGEEEAALDSLLWFKRRFGGDFYLELQDHGLPEEHQVNEVLHGWSQKHGIECVATSDVHYLEPKDAEAQEVLQCIEYGKNLDLDRPKSLVPPEYGLKSAGEMRARFERFPDACDATLRIADKCGLEFKFKDEKGRQIYHLPNFRPEGVAKDASFDLIAYFREQAREGLDARFLEPAFADKRASGRWPEESRAYRQRLEDELAMIEKTGFAGYFLIVADFINWAKDRGIPVGPGRGSGAGSLVAYALRITDIDPILFKLLFERFINPERVSMPDFDVDFCQDRRGEVIEYVTRKYGADKVSQIITFGKLQARAVIKDVGRVLGLSFAETDQISKLLPDEIHVELEDAIAREPRLREKMEQDPKVASVLKYARALEGLYRNAGVHAAGVIITERPIVEHCPLFLGRDNVVVTQFDKDLAEKVGLVKFDFLGLKTLTVIDNAVKFVRQAGAAGDSEFALARINYADPAVFALISSGDTDGVFQIESSGMKDLCTRIQPSSLEDITAINALYRPGPLGSGMVDDFIDRKHGRKPILYDVPQLEGILKDTYGVILYQEQVMQTARELAGYSLGQADMLRRAMGKKKPEEMAEHREIFVKGALAKGLPRAKAESIFDLMAKFAEYGFNKSHSAAYGVLTYQTAFLKNYYPAEFMAALMTTEMDNTDKITKYIADARAHEIPVLSPDVNRSQKRFSVERSGADSRKAVRFGLEAIKGVGGVAVDVILEARAEKPFESVLDFCRRVSTRKVNKKVLESLTLAGAFDAIAEVNRASLFASLEGLLEHAGDEQEEKELGQSSLFDSFSAEEVKLVTPVSAVFKHEEEWPSSRRLAMEKQTVGFYMSGHPMDPWQRICEDWLGWSTEKLRTFAANAPARPAYEPGGEGGSPGGGRPKISRPQGRLAGLITEMREVMTKKGSRMAFAQLEDLKGKVEIVFFPETYAASGELLRQALSEAEPVVVGGDIEAGEEGAKILAKAIEWARDAHRGRVQQVTLRLAPAAVSGDQLRELKKHFLQHRGKCPVRIEFVDPQFRARLTLPKTVCVAATPELVKSVNQIFGSDVVRFT